jgi:hypothetical protein
MRCFKSQCSVESIAGVLGLELTDLFPPKNDFAVPQKRKPRLLSDRQALELLAEDATLVGVAGSDMVKNRALSEPDYEALKAAVARIVLLAREARA